jgi:hypothetical protein
MLASSAVKATVATAGVLLVIGTAKTAEASTGKVDLDSVIPFRAVPVNDFTEQEGGALYADSSGDVPDNFYTDKQITEKFAVGVPLYYDNKKHWIFGRVSVR